jgi:hypothetical protein
MSDDYPMRYASAPPLYQGVAPHMAGDASLCSTLVSLATIGAVVGASAAGGANLLRVQREEITSTAALRETGRAALAGAAATAIAGAAASAIASQGLTRMAVLFATGTAVMYGLQRHWASEGESGANA